MRKIKKINGYLIVKFNDRELCEWEGTGLGTYGVIDAELYTGHLGIDRGAMEYDDADSLEVAIEQARGLESELEVDEPSATYTVIKETDDTTEEDEVDPQLMIAGWGTTLSRQIENSRYPDVNPATARHELYGFKVALKELGLIEPDECFVEPRHFEHNLVQPDRFLNLPPDKRDSGSNPRGYALGLELKKDCPQNDCRIYLNIFEMCLQLDGQAPLLNGWPRQVVERELRKLYFEIETMFMMNHAIKEFRRKGKEPPVEGATPMKRTLPYKPEDIIEERRTKEARKLLEEIEDYVSSNAPDHFRKQKQATKGAEAMLNPLHVQSSPLPKLQLDSDH